MRVYYKRFSQFKTIWTQYENDRIVFDSYTNEDVQGDLKNLSIMDQEKYLNNHSDVILDECPIESVLFESEEKAVYYLKTYACVMAESMRYGEYDFTFEKETVEQLDEDTFFIGHRALVKLTYPCICTVKDE